MDKNPSHPLWIAYDTAAKKLGAMGGSAARAARQNIEQQYAQSYRKLVQAGLAMPLKKKYRV